MRDMFNTGNDCLTLIPADWQHPRLKYYCKISNGSDPQTEGDIPAYGSGKEVVKYCGEYKEGPAILLGRKGTLDNPRYVEGKFWNVDTAMDAYPINGINPRFLYLVTTILDIQRYATSTAKPSMTQGDYYNMPIPLPSLDEQESIVRFVDKKCAAIDEAIERHKKIIEKLEEYRREFITYYVTHGIDNKTIYSTNNPWITGVPEGWTVCRSKYIFQNGDGGIKVGPFGSALRGKMLPEGEYKVYNQAHLINNDFTLARHFVSQETFDELEVYEVRPGDLLFSVMGTIGKCKQMPDKQQKGIMDSHLIKARLNSKMLPRFFEYVYDKDNSRVVINQLLYLSQGSIMNGLNSTIISNLYIPLPSIQEQQEIVSYLDEKTQMIDKVVLSQKQAISKLKEYRNSIIYNAVTGKIDCRAI